MSKKSSTTQREKSINIYSPFFHKVFQSFRDRIEKLCDHINRAPSHECLLGLLPYVLLRVDATFLLIGMALGQCPEILDNFKIRIVRWPLKHLNLELREKTLCVLGSVAGCILLLEEHLIDV